MKGRRLGDGMISGGSDPRSCCIQNRGGVGRNLRIQEVNEMYQRSIPLQNIEFRSEKVKTGSNITDLHESQI